MIYSSLKNKLHYSDNKILFLLLAVATIGLFVFNNYFLMVDLDNQKNQAQVIRSEKLRARSEMSPDQYINILISFASVNSKNLWIHKLKIENNNVNLTIRSSDVKSIEQYINAIVDHSDLKLQSLVTKNVKNKASADEEEEEKEPVPFAVKLYLDSIKNNELEEKEEDNESKDVEFVFVYETKVHLLQETF